MKLILIEGGPASGKNTLGELLKKKLNEKGDKAALLDMDSYVERYNSKWVWEHERQKEKDLSTARVDLAKDVNKYLKEHFTIIIIGEKFLTKDDVTNFLDKLETECPVYLYNLSIPIAMRRQRLHQRGPNSIIDLDKDQKSRDAIKDWPGYVYENVNSPEVDARNLMKLIQNKKGLVKNGAKVALNQEPFKVKLFHSVPKKFKSQISKLSYECFIAESTEQQRLEHDDKFFSKPYTRFLAIKEGKVIGEASVFRRIVSYKGKEILFGGLGGVGVTRNERKKGIGIALLKRAMQSLKRQKCDVALLCTDVQYPGLVRLYAQFGFVILNKSYTYLGKSGKRYNETGGMLAPVNSKSKFNYIMKGKTILDIGIGDW